MTAMRSIKADRNAGFEKHLAGTFETARLVRDVDFTDVLLKNASNDVAKKSLKTINRLSPGFGFSKVGRWCNRWHSTLLTHDVESGHGRRKEGIMRLLGGCRRSA